MEISDQERYQKIFFDFIKKRQNQEIILKEVSDVLSIGKGAAYKRMNGSTAMTVTELIVLANHFDVSLDVIFNADKFITCRYPFHGAKTAMDVLDQFAHFLKKGDDLDVPPEFTYLANELPVFYYFAYQRISNFLFSVWSHLHWKEHQLIIRPDDKVLPLMEKVQTVNGYYYKYATVEIWNSEMMNNLYQKIYFSINVKAFLEVQHIRDLIDEIEQLLLHLKNIAGGHVDQKTPKIYYNDFSLYLNLLLSKSESGSSTFIGYEMPQFMMSYNAHFFDSSIKWVHLIQDRSVLISSEGYRSRVELFSKLDKNFSVFRDRVEKLIALHY